MQLLELTALGVLLLALLVFSARLDEFDNDTEDVTILRIIIVGTGLFFIVLVVVTMTMG